MRKLKLFSLLLMLLVGIGQMWATEVTVSWSASTGALGSAISAVNGTASGTIATTSGTEISYNWSYTRTLVTLKSGKSDYIAMSGSYMQCGSGNAGENVEFSTNAIPGTIKSVTVLLGSKDSRHTGSITVGGTNYNAGDIPAWANSAGDEWKGTGTSSGEIVISIDCNEKKSPIYIASITVVYEEGDTPTCAIPTFSPAAGAVLSGTEVTISSSTTDATIHYTLDGSDPDENSATAQPIEITSATTIKAIAVKEGCNNSAIASASYTIATPLTTMQAIFDAATSTATPTYITFSDSWVVTGVSTNGKNVYITDGEKGMILFNTGGNMGLVVGNTLSGTVQRSLKLYGGAAELDGFTTDGLTVGTGSLPTIQELDAQGISDLDAVNTGALIKISGTCSENNSKYFVADVQLYNSLFAFENPNVGHPYAVTGVYVQYNSTKEIMPRSEADIKDNVATFTVTYNNEPDNGTLTIKNGNDVVDSGSAVSENTVLTIVTSPDEGYKLKGVTVNDEAYTASTLTLTENVTIAAEFEQNQAPLITSFVLSEIGVETDKKEDGQRVGDKVNLPSTATSCSKTFRGWSENANCAVAPEYAPGAEYTLKADNKLYAVYATPGDNSETDVFATTSLGNTNTVTEGYAVSAVAGAQSGYYQDGGSVDQKRHVQVMVSNTETQIIQSQPSAITVTAKIGGGSTNDALTNPVYAILLNASGEEIGNPVELTSAIEVKEGKDYTVNMATSNYADVRGVRVYHVKENKGTSGFNVRYYSISLSYAITSYSDYSTDCQAAVATPTFLPAAGTYTAVQNVTISTETADATIYYTTNGDEPTTSSTLYEGAISVGENMTLKAIAVKEGMANSAVATAAYTINLPLSTMQAIFDAATSTATSKSIAFSEAWVVSGVSSDGHTAYLTDGSKGLILYNNSADMELAVGNTLSGTKECTLVLYKGAAELKDFTKESLTVGTEGSVSPASIAPADLAGVNTGALISLSSWKYDGSNLTNGTTDIQPFTTLYDCSASFTTDNYYNVSGIYLQFDSKKEILPRSADDIEEVSLSDPEISYTPASATIELGEELPSTVFANPHELAISYSSNNEAVATVSNTGVIALGTEIGTAVITAHTDGDATYAAGNATYTITVNPASVSENVVILALYNTKYYAMPTALNTNTSAFDAIAVEYDGSQVTVASEADKAAIQWTRKTSGDNTSFLTKDETPKYMKGTSGGAAMSLDANVCNWSWDATNGYYYIPGQTIRSFFYKNDGVFKNYAVSNLTNASYAGVQVIVIDPANIVVTSKVSAELAYNPASDEITQGGAWSAPSLVNPHSVTITSYASDNEAVATVTDGGVIALAGGIGTAHITAHFAGDASYLEGDAVYTIKVNEVGDDLSGTWTLTSSVAAGDKIIIANVAVAGELLTMGAQNGSYREQVASTVDGEGKLTPAEGTKVFTLVDASTFGSYEGFALQASNGKYLSSASNSSNNIKEVDNVSDANAVWSIEITEGIAAIVAQGSYSRKVIRYNSSNTRFSCYAVENSMADVVIYKHGAAPEPQEKDLVRDGLSVGKWGTICPTQDVENVEGAVFYQIAYLQEQGGLPYNMVFDEISGSTLTAGQPYMFIASAPEIRGNKIGDVLGTAGEGVNGFYGYIGTTSWELPYEAEYDASHNNTFVIYNNSVFRINGETQLKSERCYININSTEPTRSQAQQAPGRRRITVAVNNEQTTTAIDELNAAEAPVKMVINGQLFILRGEKMYDATGRLVK